MGRLFRYANRRRREQDDTGMALLFVIGVLFLLSALLLVSLTFAIGQQRPTRASQDVKSAEAAAQAGLDDYLARLTNNQGYWSNNNVDASNPALKSTSALQSSSGAAIPGTRTGATFRYSVLSTPSQANGGRLVVRAIGDVNGQERSLTATYQPGSFLNYVYFSDKEDLDPLYSGNTNTGCAKRWWQGRNSVSCTEIQFGGGDTLSGPVHTNDTPMIGGTINFASKVTTATQTPYGAAPNTNCSGANCYRVNGAAVFAGFTPVYGPLVQIPATNTELKSNANDNGCVFYGATQITFTSTTMTVYSPNTTTINNPTCFNVASRNSAQTVPIKPAIYVDDYTGGTCDQTKQTALGYPRTGELQNTLTPDYSCSDGTAYVKGDVHGNVTIGSSQDIVVTGNLTYDDKTGTDIIGLVPTHTVWVYHPVKTTGAEILAASDRVTEIDAAILTIQDSFLVQQYTQGGSLGTLTIYGSLAQNYRGAVGTNNGTTGYIKNYQYDSRFALGAIQPTYFLKPTSASWQYQSISNG